MKFLLTILIFLEISCLALAQDTTCYECCVHRNKYNEKERLKFYPFNVADTIKLVSFRYHWNNYHFSDSGLTRDSLIETHVLTKYETNSVTDILYNTFKKKKGNIGRSSMCFYPRNAILFLDENGKLIDYILICFHCMQIEVSSPQIKYNVEHCEGFEALLLTFFKKAGIQFGTDLNIDFYPGETEGKSDVAPPPHFLNEQETIPPPNN